jgi:hypothetical protein
LGEAAAAEGQGAVNTFDMDGSSCGFGRVRRRPAMTIEGMEKAA